MDCQHSTTEIISSINSLKCTACEKTMSLSSSHVYCFNCKDWKPFTRNSTEVYKKTCIACSTEMISVIVKRVSQEWK